MGRVDLDLLGSFPLGRREYSGLASLLDEAATLIFVLQNHPTCISCVSIAETMMEAKMVTDFVLMNCMQ